MTDFDNGFDETDRTLLRQLQEDARTSNADLARRVDLSPSGLQKRLRKLEDAGIIQRYTAILDREAIGYDMLCFVHITLQRHKLDSVTNFRDTVQQLPEVLECHHVTGEYDYLLKIIVRNRKHLESFLMNKLTPIPAIDKLRTSIALREIKSTTDIPL
ncbi:MAG: Lrp/AsnC family transcriptional regulator [Anaerolineae bacterium]|nr:Lrp/AsnC family transcriptional regulator [Anaerolineae bacterium]MCO5187369.1 Lrp/AsnC family transcriptional regulator [Anaerolineae bacterium]MCO5193956.1 Lrp/AsnC family transcriptional regulator [Anaerolineae bacterium]MCO5196283.1 Lrp/AsnC family transcriptional regulator [Anaerolineae bacterium]MCO5204427.1 Lrp/AsnC family transcriptional regulator [Anaerolineae bacterium]